MFVPSPNKNCLFKLKLISWDFNHSFFTDKLNYRSVNIDLAALFNRCSSRVTFIVIWTFWVINYYYYYYYFPLLVVAFLLQFMKNLQSRHCHHFTFKKHFYHKYILTCTCKLVGAHFCYYKIHEILLRQCLWQ